MTCQSSKLFSGTLHERVLQAHHTNDQHIHTERETNDPHVEADELFVFNPLPM